MRNLSAYSFNNICFFNSLEDAFGERVLPEEPEFLLIIPKLTQNPGFVCCFCTAGKFLPLAFCHLSLLATRGFCAVVVTVYARQSGNCPQSKVRRASRYRRCRCPIWLRWSKSHRRSARTPGRSRPRRRANSRKKSGRWPWESRRPSRLTTSRSPCGS